MRFLIVLVFAITVVKARSPPRLIGGTATTIEQYPFMAAVLDSFDWGITLTQVCAGSILTTTAILTSSECIVPLPLTLVRVRVGSTWAHTGGSTHPVDDFIEHPRYNELTAANDIAIIRLETPVTYGPTVQKADIAGPNYVVADNQPVWAVGWGATTAGSLRSDELNHVNLLTLNLDVCRDRYATDSDPLAPVNTIITKDHLCAYWPQEVRDHCQTDMGGPLVHYNTVVGVLGWMWRCGTGGPPSLSARVSSFTPWILANV